MGIQDDKPIPYKTFAAIKSQLVTELQLTPLEWLKLLGPNLDSTGNPQNLLSTSGYVTEASAATISGYCSGLAVGGYHLGEVALGRTGAVFGQLTNSTIPSVAYAIKRIGVVPLTEAAGSIAATAIVPALAGYTAHCRVLRVWSPQTDAASTWTFAVTAGTILGPSVFTMNLVANSVSYFGSGTTTVATPGIALRGTVAADDAKDLTVSVAGLPAVGTTYWIEIEYWYET